MTITSRRPLIEELDTRLAPPALFELFRSGKNCFFLDSGMDPQKLGRYSFMGNDPFLMMSNRGDTITITQNDGRIDFKGNLFDALGKYLSIYRLDTKPLQTPFTGGAVGYLSYDLCHMVERLPSTAVDDLQLPESHFGFYDLIVACDNLLNKTYIVSTGFPELDDNRRMKRAGERLKKLKTRLGQVTVNEADKKPSSNTSGTGRVTIKSNFTHDAYLKAVAKARQYIIDGDIFEVNISQRFEAELVIPPYELYKRLRKINPAPFASYMEYDGVTIAGTSPERFLRVEGDWVETRPIKGTRARGKTPHDDRVRAKELLSSLKDHAENMMIVDLERNDLGRVCRYGTVRVTELAILEKFPTVFHLTSTVVGRLCVGKDRIELLKAAFPGGSITGAPKVRAMEIIDELEPTRRSIYTGSIGYLSFNGNMDMNIVIRTFIIKGKQAYFQVGGAVVYDSDPEEEYQETLDKARALIDSLNRDGNR
jgi:para-aminobenzoate synthetase component 1